MPSKQITELRQAGKLEEALRLATTELEAEPDNIWAKRNISWVYYDYLKQNDSPEHFDAFVSWLDKIKNLELPAGEEMLFEQLGWQIGKMAFGLTKTNPIDHSQGFRLFELTQSFHFPKPSGGYSVLFKALHKLLKGTDHYLQFADWWDLENFMPNDFQKEKISDDKEMMSIGEQAYIAYAKGLLSDTQGAEINREKIEAFLPALSKIIESHPQFQYPPYFKAKLLLALGDKDNMLKSLLPFARERQNDFWVWEMLAEAFSSDAEKVFACYCKALSCKSPKEMLVSLRQKMVRLLIAKKHFSEAKTEINLLVHAREEHGFKIPNEVIGWQAEEWYKTAEASKSNFEFYKAYAPAAEVLLFSDVPEETVIVEFVNSDKKMLNFIASEAKFGFFKYDRFFPNIKVGDMLKVRFQRHSEEGLYRLYTAVKADDEVLKKRFIKEVSGVVKIADGKPFGFIDDVFIHPSLVKKHRLTDGMPFTGQAIKSYNREKKQWGWKLL